MNAYSDIKGRRELAKAKQTISLTRVEQGGRKQRQGDTILFRLRRFLFWYSFDSFFLTIRRLATDRWEARSDRIHPLLFPPSVRRCCFRFVVGEVAHHIPAPITSKPVSWHRTARTFCLSIRSYGLLSLHYYYTKRWKKKIGHMDAMPLFRAARNPLLISVQACGVGEHAE